MARRRRVTEPDPVIEADGIPAELRDLTAPVWHDRDLYLAYMRDHGYRLDVRDRVVSPVRYASPPAHSWQHQAILGWAIKAGVVEGRFLDEPDYHRLTAMGLLPKSPTRKQGTR